MSHLWQHPYVNVFKHFNVQSWKKSTKEGEVSTLMDKTVKSTVYRITGSIPAGNYIQLPKTSTQSLGLTGRFMYMLFKPVPSKYFVVHIDVATQDGLVVRISFSNLFKEFKSTSTWLQFPFVCHAAKGSLSAHAGTASKDHSGAAPLSTRWTVLCLDFHYILSMYLNRRYSYIKSVRLCANMLIKNIFTSDTEYEPGLTMEQVKKMGMTLHGIGPLPREMAYPLPKTQNWHDLYDHIKFPTDSSKKPFDSIQYSKTTTSPQVSKSSLPGVISPRRMSPKAVHPVRTTSGKMSAMEAMTAPKRHVRKKPVVSELPAVNVDVNGDISIEQTPDGEVHVYAHPHDEVVVHQQDKQTGRVSTQKVKGPAIIPAKKSSYKSLKPDPILQLRRIVGFGGATFKDALWTHNGTTLVYPCHAVMVAMQANNGHQRFFIGHTDKISCLTLNGNSTLVASGQTGAQSVVRVWKFQTAECLAMIKTHAHSLSCLSFSHTGNVLCGVGKDNHNKNMVVVWNTERVTRGGEVAVMAKAHSEVDIVRMRIAGFDDTKMVSCGRDNVRLWRVKDGSLRSAPVNLGEYHSMEMTDCCFQAGYDATKDPMDRLVYACSRSGHIFEIDYRRVSVHHVRRLLPVDPKAKGKKEKQTFNSGSGISINCMCINESFCVTGSDDGILRLWPLDFKHVYLEAEHEGGVTSVDISSDGIKIFAGTCTGNLGILDVSTRGYTTVMRSHTGRVHAMALDPLRRHLATVSADHTIRVWDMDTMQQLYDFSAPKECATTVTYHPSQQVFAVGFESGAVRVFNVISTSMLAEHKQHRGKVIGVAYSPTGDYLYSAGSLGTVAMYDASENAYHLLRVLGNTAARGEHRGPNALAVSPDGRHVAFVGPTEFTVSIVDARSMDEMMRIDITSLNPADNSRTIIDSAVRVHYAPANVAQLLVATSSQKLLKFDARSGRILSEIDNVHRKACTSLAVSHDGRHLATTGDRVIKVWDYHMRLDLNFQVFIGHSEDISNVVFTPDQLGVISTGESILLWDFLARTGATKHMEGRMPVKNLYTGEEEEPDPYRNPVRSNLSPGQRSLGLMADGTALMSTSRGDAPRSHAPRPTTQHISDISSIQKASNADFLMGEDVESELSDKEEVFIGPELTNGKHDSQDEDDQQDDSQDDLHVEITGRESLGTGPMVQPHRRHQTPTKQAVTSGGSPGKHAPQADHPKPTVLKHFSQRNKTHGLAQRRYTAPPNQAGVKLKSVIGYNGNGRGNMTWNPDTGIFAYTSGCIIIVEDLNAGHQQHLLGHSEEISTLTLQNDCQVLASASGSFGMSASQICIWDMTQLVCKQVLTHHEHEIICLAYSRDDRFLISVGDYRECSVVVWSTQTYDILTTTKTALPIHDLKWDPFTVNEFASVGQNGTVLFWLLDETGSAINLNVHEAEVPDDLLQTHHMGSGQVDFTCLEYAGDSTLYVATNNGRVAAWDTRHNSCFMHWEADTHEIDVVVSKSGRLVTGGAGNNLRLWSAVGVSELKLPGEHNNMRTGGLTMEDEMTLDGAVVCAAFDDTLDMGIIGTTAGTLWYINWTERASIRLVSGHTSKVNCVTLSDDQFFASCSDDGSLRVWSINERDQTLQFQVMAQSCNCMAFSPLKPRASQPVTTVSNLDAAAVVSHTKQEDRLLMPNVAAGYSDGTVRMFDLNRAEMVLKMHPHAVAVTAISFSADGRMILSGGSDGLVAVSSPTTGMTVRVISDHQGAPITCIDVTFQQEEDYGVSAPLLWLAASADRRVSVWSADWSKDFCELVDWLTFPAPAFTPDGTVIKKGDKSYFPQVPPSIARFSYEEPDIIVYSGYGLQKQLQFYSLSQKKVIRTVTLTHWATTLDLCPTSPLIALGANERLLKLTDYYEGSFQDFVGHNDSLSLVMFSPDGRLLFTTSYSEILIWEVNL